MVLAVLTKEAAILVVPLVYTLDATRPADRRALTRALTIGAPALVALVGVRLMIPAGNVDAASAYVRSLPYSLTQVDSGRTSYSTLDALRRWGPSFLRSLGHPGTYRLLTLKTFGVTTIVLAVCGIPSWRRWGPVVARLSPIALFAVLQLFFASDVDRILAIALPVLLPIALVGAERVADVAAVRIIFVSGVVLTFIAIDLGLSQRPEDVARLDVVQLLLVAAVAAVLLSRRRRTAPAAAP
jgi:hypothetical protein